MTDSFQPPELIIENASGAEDVQPTPRAVPLRAYLDELRHPRDAELGAVPVPEAWSYFRAILGGAAPSLVDRRSKVPTQGKLKDDQTNDVATFERCESDGRLFAGLHIFTGQTGGGKTALVVNLAHAAASHGHPVVYVSLELDAQELAARLVGLVGDLAWYKLAQHKPLTESDTARRDTAIQSLATSSADLLHILTADKGFQLDHITRETLRVWRETGKTPLVIFDYLQLAPALIGRNAPLRELITDATFDLRTLSRANNTELGAAGEAWVGCPVVVLSTTARSNVTGQTREQSLSGENPDAIRFTNLETLKALPKEAGEIEATAVTAWVLALGEPQGDGTRPLALRLAKNRMGMPGGWVPFAFNGATGALVEAPTRYIKPMDGRDQ